MSRRFVAAAFAVLALAGTSAMAQGQRDSAAAKACEADVKTLCAGVQPGQRRIAQCLRKNQDKVSEGCKTQLEALRKQRAKDKRGSGAAPN